MLTPEDRLATKKSPEQSTGLGLGELLPST
jgi:hypothetical protein